MAKQEATAELFYSGEWHTAPAYTRDAIQVTRGRGGEQGEPTPSSAGLTLDNRDGTYNPRNPSSSLFGLIGRNTPLRIRLATPDQDVADSFSRTAVDTWNNPGADSGQTYTHVTAGGGSINDFDVAAGVGTHVVGMASSYRLSHLADVQAVNGEAVLGPVDLPTAAVTGGSLEPANIAARAQSTSSYYLFRVEYTTAEALRAQIFAPDGGSALVDNQAYSSAQWTAGEDIMVRAVWDGPELRMRVWPASVAEPTVWHAEVTDYTYLGPGAVGIRSGAAASNSNVPATFGYSNLDVSTWDTRSVGEVASWRPRRSIVDDAWTEVTGNGMLRRLNQGAPRSLSQWHRTTLANADELLAYWPCEDEARSTSAASGLPGGVSLVAEGEIDWAALDINTSGEPTFGPTDIRYTWGTKPTPNLAGGGRLYGPVPVGTSSPSEWAVTWVGRAEAGPTGSNENIVTLRWTTPDGSTYKQWEVRQTTGPDGTEVAAYDAAGARSVVATYGGQFGSTTEYRVECADDGANIDVRLYIQGALRASGNPVAADAGHVAWVSANPDENEVAGNRGLYAHHIRVWNTAAPPVLEHTDIIAGAAVIEFRGYWGETAADRMSRLCAEEDVAFRLIGDAGDTARMGSQQVNTLIALLAECERTDGGILYEARDFSGLTYRTRTSLYNQTAALVLDFTAGYIAPPIEPDVDDLSIQNDITVKQLDGSSYRAAQQTGSLSIQDPPDGIGRVASEVGINSSDDDDLADHAGWRLHLNTVDKTRYPRITVDFDAPDMTMDLIVAAGAVDIGDLVTIDNLESDQVALLVRGYSETIGSHRRTITFDCVPADAYTVATADGDERVDTDGSELTSGIDDNDTSLSVSPTSPNTGLWTTDAADFPLDIVVGGERITLSGISGASAPQTFTASARSVNGVVKAHAAGAPVNVAEPAYVPL